VYQPNSKVIIAGFVATSVMTMIMYSAPMLGLPRMDVAGMLGSLFNGMVAPPMLSGLWWLGMAIHFVDGSIIFPLIYAYAVYGWLSGSPWVRGTTWGIILWALSQAVVMPVMGAGFFSSNTPAPGLMMLGSLLGHLIYGAILGSLAGPQPERRAYAHRERHA
jgi:hypothetical protein